jgi:ferric-dicitrate binding protein FerR (iron transport regulator)
MPRGIISVFDHPSLFTSFLYLYKSPIVKDIKNQLSYLLLKEEWNQEDREWMVEYLNSNDINLLREIAKEQYDEDIEKVQQILDKKLSAGILRNIHSRIQVKRKIRKLYRWSFAAACLLLLFSVGIYRNYERNKIPLKVVFTKPGETKMLLLSDGTQVWLSPESRFIYPNTFTGNERDVSLSGEAFFQVAHNTDRPFIVNTGTLRTKVLGTSFDINAYPDRKYATVIVGTGEVSVNSISQNNDVTDSSVRLLPNQQVVYTAYNDGLRKENFPDAAKILYERRNGHLEYNGTNIERVTEDLSVMYGVKIDLASQLNNYTYYGDFNIHQDSLKSSLKVICLTLNAGLKKQGDVYVIDRKFAGD